MKDPSDVIREWVYNVLYGTIQYGGAYVAVYSFPPKDAAMPYILIGEQRMNGENQSTKDCWITEHELTLEIYSSHTGNDASYVPVNTIMDSVLQTIRTEPLDVTGSGGSSIPAFTGFNDIVIKAESMVTDRFQTETSIVMYKSIIISFLMEES